MEDTKALVTNEFPAESEEPRFITFRSHSNITINETGTTAEGTKERGLKTNHTCEYEPGHLKQISTEYESLDYDPCVNSVALDEQRTKGSSYVRKKDAMRWLVVMVIGVVTALVACCIDISTELLSMYKFSWLQNVTEKCVARRCLSYPFLLWAALNIGPVLIAAIIGSVIEPASAGSGISQVKCYLNGVKVPRLVRFKTLVCKCVGVVFAILGGLAVGKEGPMIHSGAIIAAGISQGKTTSFNHDFGFLQYFREDNEKRDFVSAGAAAGVAAAFGAPVGGVLFSLEEGASFWNQGLTWRALFGAVIACFTLNLVLSAYKGQPGDVNNPGLLNFGKFDDLSYNLYEVVVFVVMAVMGGLLGALFNFINYKLSILRIKHINRPVWKILECVCVSFLAATIGFFMIFYIADCRDSDTGAGRFPIQMFCKSGEVSTTAALWFQTPEQSVESLFHAPKDSYGMKTMSWFSATYFLLACISCGLCAPSGSFIPTILAGAAWGRLCGMLLLWIFPNQAIYNRSWSHAWVDEGKYALVGAAAMLAGVVRMTISLAVMLMECVGSITFGLPLMIVIMISKWVGDFFIEGLFDIQIGLKGMPLMAWEPPPLSNHIFASEIMKAPVVVLRSVESVRNIVNVLKNYVHNGFPVVDPGIMETSGMEPQKVYGKLRGLILRSQLTVLLKHKVFNENPKVWLGDKVNIKIFRESYPRFYSLDEVNLDENGMDSTIDLRPFMNPSPYTVPSSSNLPRMFRLFRALGLRHLIVLNDEHNIVGIVTRKDLVRFRSSHGSAIVEVLESLVVTEILPVEEENDSLRSRSHSDIGISESGTNENTSKGRCSMCAIDGYEYEPGCLNQISATFESLDYDPCANSVALDEQRTKGSSFVRKKDIMRWLVVMVIGALTGLVASCIDMSIESLAQYKFLWLQNVTERCVTQGCLSRPYLLWGALNVGPVLIAAIVGSVIEPASAGSGIPQVKCYLNGVKVPRLVRFKTLVCKSVGVTFSVLGGLAVGKEGPMIHSGAVIAAGVSQGKTTSFNHDFGFLQYFREDNEKRDFVSAGAAAGVAAAFGAPVGGVLFSLEEGASFWNQSLTWRVLFGAVISCFTLNLVLSAYKGQPGNLTNPGLLNFGKFDDLTYRLFEFVVFLLMGILGGLLGALFNFINYKLSVFRIKFINRPVLKIVEAIFVSFLTASVGFFMIYYITDCRDSDTGAGRFPIQMFCKSGEESTAAALWFQTPEESVDSLFHDPKGSYGIKTMSLFFTTYFFLACITYGLGVPSGLFIPTLLTGAAWGRLCGMFLTWLFPNQAWVDEGKYALVGAAAMLAGVVRMTISLAVILMECVGSITFGLPLMIVIIISKWVGDFFNEGLYDIHIRLMGVPLMAWDPPPLSHNKFASEIMKSPVIVLQTIESVQNIVSVLKNYPHNGFPVVDTNMETSVMESFQQQRDYGKLRGLILRSQLTVLLKHKVFNENPRVWLGDKVNIKIFRESYPRFYSLDEVNLDENDMDSTIDLRPFMNPSPYTVPSSSNLPRMFRLFRALGLRHLIVLNDDHKIVGIVTRKDLVRFRSSHGSSMVEVLGIYSN